MDHFTAPLIEAGHAVEMVRVQPVTEYPFPWTTEAFYSVMPDCVFGVAGELKPFQVGNVKFFGHNPCQRCVVPTRDPDNGQGVAGFQKTFMEQRKKTLPEWSNAQRFNHFYRFAINTSVPPSEVGKQLRVGDEVTG